MLNEMLMVLFLTALVVIQPASSLVLGCKKFIVNVLTRCSYSSGRTRAFSGNIDKIKLLTK